MANGAMVITGLSWADGVPKARVRQPPDAPSTFADLIGLAVNYSAGRESPRHCLGHKPFRDSSVAWVDCDKTPLHEGRKCDRCAAVDATFASQLHHAHNRDHGELDAAVILHLQQPNKLYVAMFRDGSVKIGTSTEARLPQRLDEQGAWIARVVADTSDGFAVRSIEDRCTVVLGLPQSVSIRRKIGGLLQPRVDSSLETELDLWTTRVHKLVAETDDTRVSATSIDWRFAGADDPRWNNLHRYPLKLESGNHHVEFVMASGRAVVLTRPAADDRFVADLHSLYGVELSVGEHEPDALAVQDSLF